MVILDYPYVSDFMLDCLVDAGIQVVKTEVSEELCLRSDINWISEKQAVKAFQNNPHTPLYSNSENAIAWIDEKLSFTNVPEKIALFKDKIRFRKLVKELYPDYYFLELDKDELPGLDKAAIHYPVILKPAVGFFSLGVYKINCEDDWAEVQAGINEELKRAGELYPTEVFDSSRFILEEYIPGREFAIDAYFDSAGQAVILNITEHFFSSSEDLSDRLYQCRTEVFLELEQSFRSTLQAIGDIVGLSNFPVHVEFRLQPDNTIAPIEINPMRFGGWCTTADLAGLSFGINPYRMFNNQEKPDWGEIFRGREGRAYSMILLNNDSGIDGKLIKSFDYDKLCSQFRNVLEIRKVDYKENPLFGFLFVETSKDEEDVLEGVLKSDLMEYIQT